MKTVKTYMVRKPSNIEEVLDVSKTIVKDCPFRVEEVLISETINLSKTEYKKVCERPLDDSGFLIGKGGYDKVDDKEYRKVVELTCEGKQPLYTDPEGSSYCRYLGLEIK